MSNSPLITVLQRYPEPPCQKGHCRCGEIKGLGWGLITGCHERGAGNVDLCSFFKYNFIFIYLFIWLLLTGLAALQPVGS